MSSTDTVEHFLKQFPLITIDKGYNGFRQYWDGQLYHFFEFSSENQKPMYAENTFLHELCHFTERSSDKIFLDNLGFTSDKVNFTDYTRKELDHIIKVEIRVNLFQISCGIRPVNYQEDDGIKHTFRLIRTYENMHELSPGGSDFWQYLGTMVSVYTYEKFWTDFNHRYELLRESAAANRSEVESPKELALSV